jgi:hypothetical protein
MMYDNPEQNDVVYKRQRAQNDGDWVLVGFSGPYCQDQHIGTVDVQPSVGSVTMRDVSVSHESAFFADWGWPWLVLFGAMLLVAVVVRAVMVRAVMVRWFFRVRPEVQRYLDLMESDPEGWEVAKEDLSYGTDYSYGGHIVLKSKYELFGTTKLLGLCCTWWEEIMLHETVTLALYTKCSREVLASRHEEVMGD